MMHANTLYYIGLKNETIFLTLINDTLTYFQHLTYKILSRLFSTIYLINHRI